KGGEKKVVGMADPIDLGSGDGSFPVFRVKAEDARQCARWLGGDLPTTRQWLAAAGANDPQARPGPFQGELADLKPGEVAIDLEKVDPLPIGKAAKDFSSRGCRDMASNGREWTRTIKRKTGKRTDEDAQVPFP